MTYEQKEQQILSLIGSLPIFQRIRIALTILRGIAPEEIHPTVADEQMPWETEEFMAELDRRSEELRLGKVKGVPGEDFLTELRSMRNS
ncbi:MAG: addiction module protein [Bacteroidia bacterium]